MTIVVPGVIGFGTKTVSATTTFHPSGYIVRDMSDIKRFYRASRAVGRHPEKFTSE